MVGAGVIGSGVGHLFAQSGHEVVLVDRRPEQLDTARGWIAKNARLFAFLQKDLPPPGEVLPRIDFTTDLERLASCDFVVENITENWEMKRELHQSLDRILSPGTPLAANTSAIPITRIAGVGRHPERVVGMHFMNPVPVMPMVEIIRAVHSSEAAMQAARTLVEEAGKQSIAVNDSPGFVTNRVMMLMVNEAMFLVHEGVASVPDVDRLFQTCFGHKMGPLATADLIGLDTVLLSLDTLYLEFNDSKYRPCPLLKQKVYAGLLGRKSGEGFHRYRED
ncbi:3-hydroxyacyl-CoA dehydrogenase family protein [Azospirillum thermophilum]|uniref:3-hydroxyacyl-CoA dehydrogenase family protein n=1 Tax=Azospirillum thermophilum TaxID=2202148 RepID=UPI002481CDFA|nr:3-hydroxyacyl-CoA dehydrogenase NAD-binding domain-containing protein [Azospirillum thermophilum]